MRVARVVLHAGVASFRHPFFVTGRQPSAEMPPPSTIHGLCASAAGRWPDPVGFVFGMHFTYRSRCVDLEHQHLITALSAKTRLLVPADGGGVRATTEVGIQPVQRDFLFDCTLTLYLPAEMGPAFRAPVFPLVLGRSQDLAAVCSVDAVELDRPGKARLEHTLLPRSYRPCIPFGATVLLSRHIGPPPQRTASFAQYICLSRGDHVVFGEDGAESRAVLQVPGVTWDDLWTDSGHRDDDGNPRGVFMLRLFD
jgi:CRISPR-associated protein Cas5t